MYHFNKLARQYVNIHQYRKMQFMYLLFRR